MKDIAIIIVLAFYSLLPGHHDTYTGASVSILVGRKWRMQARPIAAVPEGVTLS